MCRLIGKKVRNEQLGDGIITNAEDTKNGIIITVKFPTEEKRYGFPTALGKALSSDDLELQRIAEEISEAALEEAKRIMAQIDRDVVFEANTGRVFKVHQGQTFQDEFMGGYLWAPADGLHHHERMNDLRPGDIVFHYAGGALVAVSEVLSACFMCPQPVALAGHGWGPVGYRVEVRYQLLDPSYSLAPHTPDIIANRAEHYSSFDHNGDACQGYLYELEHVLALLFKNGILATTPPPVVVRVLNRIV